MKKTILFSAVLLSQTLFAAGPSVGGGGDIIVLPDDSVVIADPFLDHGQQQPNMDMPARRALNPRVLKTIRNYGKAAQAMVLKLGRNNREIITLIEQLANRDPNLVFYAVKSEQELTAYCASGGRKTYRLPTGGYVQQVACTAGNDTFLVEPLFARLSLRDQGLLLIHERLTTLRDQYGNKNYSAIARFTTGLNIYLTLYKEQASKNFRTLSPDEVKNLSEFYISIQEIAFRNQQVDDDSFEFHAHVRGGGAVHSQALVHPTAIVPAQMIIAEGNRIGANSIIVPPPNDFVVRGLEIGENVRVTNVVIEKGGSLNAGDNAVVSDTAIQSKVTVGRDSTLSNSKITDGAVTLGSSAKVDDLTSSGYIHFGDRTIANTLNCAGNLTTEASVRLQNLQVSAGASVFFSAQSESEFSKFGAFVRFEGKAKIINSQIDDFVITVKGPISIANSRFADDRYRPITGKNPEMQALILAGNQSIDGKELTTSSLNAYPRSTIIAVPPVKEEWIPVSMQYEYSRKEKNNESSKYVLFGGEFDVIEVTSDKGKRSCGLTKCKANIQAVKLRIFLDATTYSGNELTIDSNGLAVPAGTVKSYTLPCYNNGFFFEFRHLLPSVLQTLEKMGVRAEYTPLDLKGPGRCELRINL